MTSLTTAQISRLTAGITGTAPKGASTKEAAATRFRKMLAEAIGQMNADARADNILGAASFDEATDFLRIALGRRPEQTPEATETPEKPARAAKTLGKRTAILEAAKGGQLPPKPDFSAPTHERFRGKLDEVHAAAIAGDLTALRAFEIKATSSSPKAIAKYRDLCVIAIEARATGKQEA